MSLSRLSAIHVFGDHVVSTASPMIAAQLEVVADVILTALGTWTPASPRTRASHVLAAILASPHPTNVTLTDVEAILADMETRLPAYALGD